jgi:hypothetical protein
VTSYNNIPTDFISSQQWWWPMSYITNVPVNRPHAIGRRLSSDAGYLNKN